MTEIATNFLEHMITQFQENSSYKHIRRMSEIECLFQYPGDIAAEMDRLYLFRYPDFYHTGVNIAGPPEKVTREIPPEVKEELEEFFAFLRNRRIPLEVL